MALTSSKLLMLREIYDQMAKVAHEDQAPVVVDRLQFLDWVVSLGQMLGEGSRTVYWSPPYERNGGGGGDEVTPWR